MTVLTKSHELPSTVSCALYQAQLNACGDLHIYRLMSYSSPYTYTNVFIHVCCLAIPTYMHCLALPCIALHCIHEKHTHIHNMYRYTCIYIYVYVNVQTCIRICIRIFVCTCICMHAWMDTRMDGWMDGYKDGWMDGWMDGRTHVCMYACVYVCMYA